MLLTNKVLQRKKTSETRFKRKAEMSKNSSCI